MLAGTRNRESRSLVLVDAEGVICHCGQHEQLARNDGEQASAPICGRELTVLVLVFYPSDASSSHTLLDDRVIFKGHTQLRVMIDDNTNESRVLVVRNTADRIRMVKQDLVVFYRIGRQGTRDDPSIV